MTRAQIEALAWFVIGASCAVVALFVTGIAR
jgi:hypothetical protein